MKNAICTVMTTLALAGYITVSSWADSDDDTDDQYVSTEHLDDPFGDNSQDYTESHARIFPLVKYDREGEDTSMKILHAPLVTVFKAKKNENEHKVEIVDVPFFTLAQTKSRKNGEFANKFLKLPILGSLFHHKRQGDREKIRFLIFSHTRTVDPEKYGNDAYKRKPVPLQSRGKGGARRY